MGAFSWMNGSSTNSVKPPARAWMDRITRRCPTQCAGVSTCPYIIVAEVRRPSSCAVVITSATMMYGHVDTPAHWVGHLRVIRSIQERTGGFTQFLLLPFIHQNSPLYLPRLAPPPPPPRGEPAPPPRAPPAPLRGLQPLPLPPAH